MEVKSKTYNDKHLAIVLGAGGQLGAAWESGLIAGLVESNNIINSANQIMGTSAGAIIGSQLALGRDPKKIFQGQIEMAEYYKKLRPVQLENEKQKVEEPRFIQDLREAGMQGIIQSDLLIKVGKLALGVPAMPEDQFLANFSPLVRPKEEWPYQFVCLAIDVNDGTLAVWNKSSHVDLVHAIAASAASPFATNPIQINGHYYMDGGIRSTTNADVATDFDLVLILAPSAALMPKVVEAQTTQERGIIEKAGGKVMLITPDASSIDKIGLNLMDLARGGEVANAGFQQSKMESSRLNQFLTAI